MWDKQRVQKGDVKKQREGEKKREVVLTTALYITPLYGLHTAAAANQRQ